METILIKIIKFVFPMDFVILDIEVDHKFPRILGHPFLRTSRAVVDVFKKKITLQVGYKSASFRVPDLMKETREWDDNTR